MSRVEQEQQLNAFLTSVAKRALRMAEIAIHNHVDALELVQEAMFGLVKHYAKHDPESWPALFHRILQNRIRDWHRRHKLRATILHWFGKDKEARNVVEPMPDPRTSDPALQMSLSDAGSHLLKALQSLPLRQQQVFMLRVWEGLNVQDTATVMGCSNSSVKTHYSRATQKLKAELEEYWP